LPRLARREPRVVFNRDWGDGHTLGTASPSECKDHIEPVSGALCSRRALAFLHYGQRGAVKLDLQGRGDCLLC